MTVEEKPKFVILDAKSGEELAVLPPSSSPPPQKGEWLSLQREGEPQIEGLVEDRSVSYGQRQYQGEKVETTHLNIWVDQSYIGLINITSCARCGGNHSRLFAEELNSPHDPVGPERYTHWCMCPETEQPILVAQAEKEGTRPKGNSFENLPEDVELPELLKEAADTLEEESGWYDQADLMRAAAKKLSEED